MPENLPHLFRFGDDRKDTHRSGTTRTDQRINFVYLGNELGLPWRAALRAPAVFDRWKGFLYQKQLILHSKVVPTQEPADAQSSIRQGRAASHATFQARPSGPPFGHLRPSVSPWFGKTIAVFDRNGL